MTAKQFPERQFDQHRRFVWFVDEPPIASTNKADRTRCIGWRKKNSWPRAPEIGFLPLQYLSRPTGKPLSCGNLDRCERARQP
jgi:hypothetical protein